jgi:hypothetical protein
MAHTLFTFLEEEFGYILEKYNIIENSNNYIYYKVKDEYIKILSKSVFMPIKLPMLCEPKI